MTATAIVKASLKQPPPLHPTMTCEAAFRTAATYYVDQLRAQHKDTAAGEAEALHVMRVALTRLRATIALFSPMIEGDDEMRLAAELKWLHAHLGIVRDHRKLIRRNIVSSPDDKVAEVFSGHERLPSKLEIVEAYCLASRHSKAPVDSPWF